jgi:cell division protein FtsQ
VASTRTARSGTTVSPHTRQGRRTRRRFARRQWARRWLTLRYVVGVLVLVALVAAAVWAVWFSAWLSVRGVEVTGAAQLSAAEVRSAAAVPTGEPLAGVDLDQVRSRVEAMAGVRSADVTRQWPDTVRVRIEERVALAVVEIGGQTRGMDAAGVIFRDYAKAPAGLPRVQTSAATRSDALQEAAEVIAALPGDLASRVDHVEVHTVDQISLVLRDGRTVAGGSSEDSDTKAEVLAVLLQRRAETYDVSVPGQPTTSG